MPNNEINSYRFKPQNAWQYHCTNNIHMTFYTLCSQKAQLLFPLLLQKLLINNFPCFTQTLSLTGGLASSCSCGLSTHHRTSWFTNTPCGQWEQLHPILLSQTPEARAVSYPWLLMSQKTLLHQQSPCMLPFWGVSYVALRKNQ